MRTITGATSWRAGPRGSRSAGRGKGAVLGTIEPESRKNSLGAKKLCAVSRLDRAENGDAGKHAASCERCICRITGVLHPISLSRWGAAGWGISEGRNECKALGVRGFGEILKRRERISERTSSATVRSLTGRPE